MQSGSSAGGVNSPPQVLLLIFNPKKKAFVGVIPDDQVCLSTSLFVNICLSTYLSVNISVCKVSVIGDATKRSLDYCSCSALHIGNNFFNSGLTRFL